MCSEGKKLFFYLFIALSHLLQQQGRYEDDFVPTESSLQALEGEGDFMMNFFSMVRRAHTYNNKTFLGDGIDQGAVLKD